MNAQDAYELIAQLVGQQMPEIKTILEDLEKSAYERGYQDGKNVES